QYARVAVPQRDQLKRRLAVLENVRGVGRVCAGTDLVNAQKNRRYGDGDHSIYNDELKQSPEHCPNPFVRYFHSGYCTTKQSQKANGKWQIENGNSLIHKRKRSNSLIL
ncbi:MAG: DUF2961 domain-containing protein, partial [Clostridia bacterium]|nr:DUF2961 domain-containing protein [Clostridia bacterium]